jgi:hypothetical protein
MLGITLGEPRYDAAGTQTSPDCLGIIVAGVLVFPFCWFYMGGAGVPSDHLGTITKKTAMGGKLLSCGYASADKYQ